MVEDCVIAPDLEDAITNLRLGRSALIISMQANSSIEYTSE